MLSLLWFGDVVRLDRGFRLTLASFFSQHLLASTIPYGTKTGNQFRVGLEHSEFPPMDYVSREREREDSGKIFLSGLSWDELMRERGREAFI